LNGAYTVDGSEISFGPMATTRKLCPGFEDEQRVMQIFEGGRKFSTSGDSLFFYSAEDTVYARFIRDKSE
jgi:putative lipoprotein